MDILSIILSVVVTGLGAFGVYYARHYILTVERLRELKQAEEAAIKFVQSAEQSINLILDSAENMAHALSPEYKQYIADERSLYNADKKAYALQKIKTAFPNVNINVLDAFIESAVLEYKRATEDAEKNKFSIVPGSNLTKLN